MSKVFICDYCGETIGQYESYQISIIKNTYVEVDGVYNEGFTSLEERSDICPNCIKEIKKMRKTQLKNGKKPDRLVENSDIFP